jgi:3-oxoacyl-[acyl-carrier protein] reductase
MKYALVTGGSRGIGKAICCKLAELNYPVLINYNKNKIDAENTLALILDAGFKGELLQFNVAERNNVKDILENWYSQHSGDVIEILVNNAGIRKDNLMVFMNDSEWDDVIRTNLDSFYNVTKPLLKNMILNKYGRIISIVSLSGIKGLPGQTNYSASKAGIIAATKALAQEVGKKNITVNAIAPGFIATEMISNLNEKDLLKMIPLNRFGRTEEVANLVAFLASEKAAYITGEVISINGGLYT